MLNFLYANDLHEAAQLIEKEVSPSFRFFFSVVPSSYLHCNLSHITFLSYHLSSHLPSLSHMCIIRHSPNISCHLDCCGQEKNSTFLLLIWWEQDFILSLLTSPFNPHTHSPLFLGSSLFSFDFQNKIYTQKRDLPHVHSNQLEGLLSRLAQLSYTRSPGFSIPAHNTSALTQLSLQTNQYTPWHPHTTLTQQKCTMQKTHNTIRTTRPTRNTHTFTHRAWCGDLPPVHWTVGASGFARWSPRISGRRLEKRARSRTPNRQFFWYGYLFCVSV